VSEPVLHTDSLTRTFRLPRAGLGKSRPSIHAVRRVDLQVHEGETLGLVGESGSGKTTLAHLLMGLDQPSSGSVYYGGRNLADMSKAELRELRGSMQIIFQDPNGSLDPRLKVGTIITEPLRALRINVDHQARLKELLDAVGLPPASVDRYPHEFSGGQRQRIAIARALAPDPRVLIADEPVSALDVSVRAKTLNLLQDLKEQFDLTLVMISHDLSVIHHVCDHVAVMYAGRVVETGPVEELFGRPDHPYTNTLLAAIPRLRGGELEADDLADTPVSVDGSSTGCAFAPRCTLVHDRCHSDDPELIAAVKESDRTVACHAMALEDL